MPLTFGSRAFLLQALLLAATTLAASGARAEERCTGTFCDYFYGGSAPDTTDKTAQPAAPTPLTVPKGGILGMFSSGGGQTNGQGQAARPLVGIGGGGLAATARGAPPERCSGTFCDLYYGGPPPAQPETANAAPQGTSEGTPQGVVNQGAPAADPDATPAADPDAAPEPPLDRRASEIVERPEKPICASPSADPWKCYR